MLLILNLPLIGIFVRMLYIPVGVLLPLILAICAIGVYSINGNALELYMALGFGVMGYVFRKIDIPLAPLVLSLVLGGIMEQSFRQAMTISGANPIVFVKSTICVVLLIAAVVLLMAPVLFAKLRDWRAAAEDVDS